MPRIELFKDKSYWKYGFSLKSLQTTIKFFAESKDEAVKWFNDLKKKCEVVALHFSRDFFVGRILERSACAKIRIATSTSSEDFRKFSIKSVFRNKLVENSQLLV